MRKVIEKKSKRNERVTVEAPNDQNSISIKVVFWGLERPQNATSSKTKLSAEKSLEKKIKRGIIENLVWEVHVQIYNLIFWFKLPDMVINLVLFIEECLIIVIVVLINVAFLTLLERKILRLRQIRVGPNKVGAWGVLQPAADAVKLFTNRLTFLGPINKAIYFFSPVLRLGLTLAFLVLISPACGGARLSCALICLFMLLRLNIYPLIGAGWGSGRKYASLGGLRAIAQTIAYEISLAFLCISFFVWWGRRKVLVLYYPSGLGPVIVVALPLFLLWRVTCIAELNRTPFDFAEGESELVSGFNVEYGSVKFAIIFIAEYGIIYFFSVLSSYLFFRNKFPTRAALITGVVLRGRVVWLRVTLPRFRYDLLMGLTWKKILPWSLGACQLVSVAAFFA